jgi:hypothetical protein
MMIVTLSPPEIEALAEALMAAEIEVLVAVDPDDRSFKVKIDGGIWSPPMGKPVSW